MLTAFVALAVLAERQPVLVTPPAFANAREAQVAIDTDHRVYVAYGLADAVYLSVSTDEGASYSQPRKVAEAGKLALGMRRGPRITVFHGVVTITATYAKQGGGRDGDLVAFRSADGGQTWTGPVQVNDVEGAAREGLHAMAAGPDGTVACTWLDLRGKGTKLYLSTSKDGGTTWSGNRMVYASPSGSICECCHPSIAFGPKGQLYAMFRNSIQGARDMYFATSPDGGRTFGQPTKLGRGTWMLNACPMDGGAFGVSPTGEISAVWRREGTLYRTGASGEERLFAEGRQPWITSGRGGTYVVWSDGRRLLASTPSELVSELSQNANDGVVVASPDKAFAIASWTENGIRSVRL